ncbi:nf-x1 finger transcription [Ophiostoma piceae UAMH 11346]|uniref:Nf-x1 finger transcription n=1 Tax=Ophiostoma piceae (strain UAMH 11346) TaxID=1262450 RepID=S3BZS0_OPHP1|nr:nf-x1 finger transcription [Ophiostoma piceae UAMH 11346]
MSASTSGLNPEASTWGSWNQPQNHNNSNTAAESSSVPQPGSSGRGRRNRGPAGEPTRGRDSGRGRGRAGQRSLAQRAPGSQPSQQQPEQAPPPPQQPAQLQAGQQQQQQQPPRQPRQQLDQSTNRGARGNGRSSRGGRGGRAGASIVPLRAFGSQLSRAEPPAGAPQGEGSSRSTRNRRRNNQRGGHADDGASVAASEATGATASSPRLPPSTASDLTTRIHEDIDSGNYDCPICLNAVTRKTRVWSCSMCYHVAHYSCVASWVKKAHEQGLALDKIRCPACNSEDSNSSWTSFHEKKLCWCGKQKTAGAAPAALPPHSCGRICGRKRQNAQQPACDHTCPTMCHAGPCPPCTEMGPLMTCFCGKQTSIKECALSTGLGVSWSCGAPCSQLMACGVHRCERTCHVDDCGPCKVPLPSTCYCGKVDRELLCKDRKAPETSWSASTASSFEGTFDCNAVCGRAFDCGKHHCTKPCHAQDEQAEHCPTSVDIVTHCLCGKTHLALILGSGERTSCDDPVPSCGKVCNKKLPGCSHACQELCHDTAKPCPPCKQIIDDICACHQTTHQVVCGDSDARDAAQCDSVCRAWLNCKQHRCPNICCSGKPKAAQRILQSKRKAAAPVDFEAEHMCVRPCGRVLKCGRHTCPQVCHKGACHSCVSYLHEALSCPCGRTAIEPPYLCGTTLPRCDFDCPRPLPCGHASVPHRCHDVQGRDGRQAQPCPRCQRLVTKSCLCGKLVLQKVACGADNIQCNNTCGATLKCGVHKCRLGCHAPGRCEDADADGDVCSQVCGRPKSLCGHGCTEPCHGAESRCSEAEACGGAVEIHCPCGRLAKRVRCNAKESEQAEQTAHAEDSGEAEQTDAAPPARLLECDDECLRIKRNIALREALRISDDYKDEHMVYSGAQMEYFMANRAFATAQETTLREFAAASTTSAADASAAASDSAKRALSFKPMKRHERQFVHSMAETLGLRSEARDEEPHRYVIVSRPIKGVNAVADSPGADTLAATSAIPELTLAESEEIYKRLKDRAAEDAALAASEALKEQAAKELELDKLGKQKQAELLAQRVLLPPFNAIYVPAAATAAGSPPLACDAFQAILEAWQQTVPERADDRATLEEHALDQGSFVLRIDMPGSSLECLETFLMFVLSYLVDPSALPSATAHLCHVDEQWNVLRRATTDADAETGDRATSQWNIVAGRTGERSGMSTPATSTVSPPSLAASSSASASGSGSGSFPAFGSGSGSGSGSSSTPPKRIFTLRKKVVTTSRNSSASSSSAAFRSEAERRRWMDILAAQPTEEIEADDVDDTDDINAGEAAEGNSEEAGSAVEEPTAEQQEPEAADIDQAPSNDLAVV